MRDNRRSPTRGSALRSDFSSSARRGKIYYASIHNTCKCCAPIYLPLLIPKNLTPLRALRFLGALFIGLALLCMRRIHLSCPRPRVISRQASILRKHRFLPLQASKNLRFLRANRGLFPKSAIFGNASNYLNIYSRKGNRNFPQRTPIWQSFALREEGEFAPLQNMCALKKGAKSGETVAEPTIRRRTTVSP